MRKLTIVKKDSKNKPWLYTYGEYEIRKTGTPSYPYNIYKNGKHVGFERKLKDCIYGIDINLY